MATSSFKSTSKRTTTASSSSSSSTTRDASRFAKEKTLDSRKRAIPRRSRSVSAFSGRNLDVDLDFVNKRENPLFWAEGSPHSDGEGAVNISKFDGVSTAKSSGNGGGGGGGGGRTGVGRSLSRVDNGRRRRSPSRGRYGNDNYESAQERECGFLPKCRSKTKIDLGANCSTPGENMKIRRSSSDLSDILRGLNTSSSSQHLADETSDDSVISMFFSRISNWEDDRSTVSVPEAEERTIKPVAEEVSCSSVAAAASSAIAETVRTEVRRAISDIGSDFQNATLRSNSHTMQSTNVADFSSDLVNPSAVEVVRDIRGDYARRLQESEELARKLRAELAAEEHRGLELNEVLKEIIIPELKTPSKQKPRVARKASIERRKMSRRLEEEAMAYFDECVSISTFDDSDFSSLEDPPSVGVIGPADEKSHFQEGAPCRETAFGAMETQDRSRPSPPTHSCEDSSSTADTNGMESSDRSRQQFSFGQRITKASSLEQDIRNFVNGFAKDRKSASTGSHFPRRIHHHTDEYSSRVPIEKFLSDRMTFKNSIESGSMLLCGGATGFRFAAFGSLW